MKKSHSLLFVLCFALATQFVNAQIPVAWAATYNGPSGLQDNARAIAVDAAGCVYVAGFGSNTSQNWDMTTAKYSADGNLIWARHYDRGVGFHDEGRDMVLDADANVYVTGYSMGSGTVMDIVTIKYDSSGTQQWVSFYIGPANDDAYSVAVNSVGDVFVCGTSVSVSSGSWDAITIKYNASGVQQWAQTYDGSASGDDFLYQLALDGSSNVYVTGAADELSTDDDFLTIKYDSSGTQQWLQTSGVSGNDFANAITLDNNNNVIVTGRSSMLGAPDFFTIKYSNSGTQQWTARYNYAANHFEEASDVATDNAGYIYVTGSGMELPNTNYPSDFVTVKYSPSGGEVWVKRYDGGFGGSDGAVAIAVDDTANVYITGGSENVSNGDGITIKYDSSGTLEYELRYHSQLNRHESAAAIVLHNGDIFIAGTIQDAITLSNNDMFTIRYSYTAVGISEAGINNDEYTVYPVPASDVINIHSENGNLNATSYCIYSVTGALITKENCSAVGGNTLAINVSNLQNGSYILVLENEDGSTQIRRRFVKE